jgi:uncharacterized protein YacL
VPENDFADALSTRALDTIDTVVATVNDKAIRPVVVAARGVVFGLIIAVVAMAVLLMTTVGLVRLLTVYAFDHKVWITYLVLSALFSAGGAFLYSKRGSVPHV